MPTVRYVSDATITDLSSATLESTGTEFLCSSVTDDPQKTGYADIKAGIIGNPGALGGVTAATSLAVDGAVTINESGADVDMRVEGDTDANLLYVDAGNDRVGIGTDTPATKLDVNGTMKATSIQVGDSVPFTDSAGTLTLQNVDALDATTQATILAYIESISKPQYLDEFWTGQGGEWATRVTTGSVAIQTKDNGWIRMTTGAVITNEESLDWNDVCQFANTKRPSFECRLQLEQVTVLEVYVGFMEASGGSDDDYITIGFDAYSQNTWFLSASSAGTATTDMGAVADTNEVKLRFEFTSDTALEWFIDDVSQGTVSSNVPTVQLQPVIMIKTQEAAVHYVDIDYVKIWQDRA